MDQGVERVCVRVGFEGCWRTWEGLIDPKLRLCEELGLSDLAIELNRGFGKLGQKSELGLRKLKGY